MYLKIVKCDTQYEVYRYEGTPNPPKPRLSRRNPEDGYRRPIERTIANTRRARKDFVRLVRANLTGEECPAFLTLTMRDIVSVSVGYSCLKGFISSLRHIFGQSFRYIAVPEFQKRGAVHFHILIWGLPQTIVENERRNRLLQNIWACGYVDIVSTDGSPKLAGYLGKYMSKSLLSGGIGFSKAYTCSRNVLRPMSFSTTTTLKISEMSGISTGDKVLLTERQYEVPFLGACTYQLFVKKT